MQHWTQPVTVSRASLELEPVNLRQVIAYNLQQARRGRELAQRELAEDLRAATGKKWTVSAVSAAEAGWSRDVARLRSFDATDLLAFCLVLHVPIAYFLLAPAQTPEGHSVDPDTDLWIELGKPNQEDSVSVMTSTFLTWVALSISQPHRGRDLMAERLGALPDDAFNSWPPGAVRQPVSEVDRSFEVDLLTELSSLVSRHKRRRTSGAESNNSVPNA